MPDRNELVDRLADLIARHRFGPGVDMGGAHNPRPSETASAGQFIDYMIESGYRRVSADEDTVERVAKAIHGPACGCDGSLHSPDRWDATFRSLARAAINAIGGNDAE